MARLSVDLNRERIYEIASQRSFETDGPFDVLLQNHGKAVHVHLALDDSLSEITTLDATNQYVEANGRQLVRIETTALSVPVTGRLKVVTGYGAESAYTTVTVSPPGTGTDHVEVDEQLAQPPKTEPAEPTLRQQLAEIGPDWISLPFIGVSAAIIGFILLLTVVAIL